MSELVLLTDHASGEGSRHPLEAAVEILTGTPPLSIDARHFMTGGRGRAVLEGGTLKLEVPSEGLKVEPSAVLIYEIPPAERRRYETFRHTLRRYGAVCLDTDPEGWTNATEKDRTVRRFVRDRIRHMNSICLRQPSPGDAVAAFEQLGGDVWARPTIGSGGQDVFHITSPEQLLDALAYYEKSELEWLVARDAQNFDHRGRRHQFRVVVLQGRVVRVCEHVQSNPDSPCNQLQGAVSTLMACDELAPEVLRLAVSATESLGLPFGGVDLATENGGVVFEVNVHPQLDVPEGLETVAIPWVAAHLELLPGPG